MPTLLSWNVQGRVARLPEQAERVIDAGAELICLQEVAPSTAPRWKELLAQAGWPHQALAKPAADRTARRPLSVMTASRTSLQPIEIEDLPWRERALATFTGGLEVVNVHSPISPSPDLAKVRTHEALHRHLRRRTGPAVLCGDLNTPRKEHPDGRVWTFARDQYGRLRPDRGVRWDEAELALVKGLEPFGFRDGFRALHGLEAKALSWEWPRWGGGYRLDHLIASADVKIDEVTYIHEWRREDRLSDHSALWARISLR